MAHPRRYKPMFRADYGGSMQLHHLMPLFGLRSTSHWPDEGHEGMNVQGHFVFVNPKADPRYWNGRRLKSSKHRVMFRCSHCQKIMPFGWHAQHGAIH